MRACSRKELAGPAADERLALSREGRSTERGATFLGGRAMVVEEAVRMRKEDNIFHGSGEDELSLYFVFG